MGKLLDRLNKQLTTEYKQDAEDCLKIYNRLKEKSGGHVWGSDWNKLVNTTFKGYPSDERRFNPTDLGYIFLKGTEEEPSAPTEAMIEFAKLHVKAALEAAYKNAKLKEAEKEDEQICWMGNDMGCAFVLDKKSILNSYPDENIK